MKIRRNQKGFTLIEVVLVLAIGGLIFLLAFLAFQQVSRNRRDTQRRADASRVVAELQNFYGDVNANPRELNNGTTLWSGAASTPEDLGVFVNKYLGGNSFKDPGGRLYIWYAQDTFDATAAPVEVLGTQAWPISYRANAKCNTSGGITTGETGIVAVRIKLETGIVCRDSK